jgi:predicted O-methyltransferase YrrM
MSKRYAKLPLSKSFLMEFNYGIKHPFEAVKKISSVIKHRELYLKTRLIQGPLSWDAGIMLHNIVMESKHPSLNVIEAGSYQGRSTIFLADAAKKKGKKVYSFDWFKGLDDVNPTIDTKYRQYNGLISDKEKFERNLKNANLSDVVEITVGDARKTLLPKITSGGFSVAFLDVDLYDVTQELLKQLMSIATGGEVIIVHDLDWPGIEKAVREFSLSYKSKIEHTITKADDSLNSIIFKIGHSA